MKKATCKRGLSSTMKGRKSGWDDRNDRFFLRALGGKLYGTVSQGKQGMVFTNTYVVAGVKLGAALTHDDAAGVNSLTAVGFDAQSFRLGIAAIT